MKHEEYERMYRFEDTYWWFVSRRHLIVSLIETHYPRKSDLRILDIGCGTGAMLEDLSDFGQVTGADFALEALRFCRERNPEQTLARADARRLPFATDSFDIVTAMDVVEHIDNDKAAMSEILRVLKPGGRVFVTVPAYQSLWSEHDEALHHYRRYTSGSLKDVFQRVGLNVEKLSYAVTSLFPLAWTYRKLQNLLPKRNKDGEKKANLIEFSAPVNKALISILRKEAELVQRAPLPFGLTVACVARKGSD
ncbi:MAG: methyltransferase domain-containing protein [Capsulimonas sp.]|uniref:class I SAM-dependent methyltransferase n=1 Tax=Capsulimonas sp. TaxID=2494211 RepID=UPI0032656F82